MPSLKLIPPALPNGILYCPANWQQAMNDAFNLASGQMPAGGNGIWYGDTPPTDPVAFPVWVRTAAGVPVFPSMWYLQNGIWVARHPIPALSGDRKFWVNTEASLWSNEGGDGTGNPATITTGPMWIADPAMADRFALGAGTLPSGTVITNGTTGGEENHVLTIPEIPIHTHDFTVEAHNTDAAGSGVLTGGQNSGFLDGTFTGTTTAVGGGLPHNNMPPYYGGFWAMRTARVWVTAPY